MHKSQALRGRRPPIAGSATAVVDGFAVSLIDTVEILGHSGLYINQSWTGNV